MKGSQTDAKGYALKLLGYRARSKREMIERLQGRGFDDECIGTVVAFLESSGLINDEALVSDLYHHAVENKALGRSGIRMFLSRRGIPKDLIDAALVSHTGEAEEKAALKFARRKMKTLQRYPDDVVKKRLWGMLQRRGISKGIIYRVVNSVLSEM